MNHIQPNICQTNKINKKNSIPQAFRFYSVETDPIPGPGCYFLKDSYAPGIKFSMNKRTSFYHLPESPAPGSYDIPSTFNVKKRVPLSPKFKKPEPPEPAEHAEPPVAKSLSLSTKIPINLHESFEFTQTNTRRTVFGREKRKDNFLNMEMVKNPGPGEYTQRSTLGAGPRWRFGSEPSRKYADIEDFPGPGSYRSPSTLNSLTCKFTSGRKEEKVSNHPGPGHYNVIRKSQYKNFAISKAEKFDKILGPALPGPSDYWIQDWTARQTTSACTSYKLNNSSSTITS